MESVYQVFRVNPRGAYMQWLFILFFLVAMSTMGRGVMHTEDHISDLDMPVPAVNIFGVYGKKASLPCDTQPLAANDTVMMVLWFKETNWEPIYSYDVRGRSTNLPKLWSAPNGFGSRAFFRASAVPSTLLIDNVTCTDVGVYRCRVDFKNSPTRNLRVNFTVVISPNEPIIMDLKTKDTLRLLDPYNEGDTVELLCQVKGGYPSPSLIWYLENTVIDDSYEVKDKGVIENILIFPLVDRQHLNLRFICQASNTNLVPPQTTFHTLDINLRPLTVEITNKQQLSADRTYELSCTSFGSRPEAEVTWWKGLLPLKKNTITYSDDNSTTTVLMFVAEAKDHDVELVCKAENPKYTNSVIKDTWKLNIFYFPIVHLKIGSNLNPSHIKEGDDVYFECNVKANPKATNFSWFKDHSQEIKHNASSGVILSEQSLVLQNVHRNASGEYTCRAQNSVGRASSNSVSLQVRYSPVCNSEEGQVFGASRFEPIELSCIVDSSPQPTSFEWAFNRNSDYCELPHSLSTVRGHKSILRYIPKEDNDFGTLSCWATNTVGRQEIPCTYNLVLIDRPTSLQNCSIVSQSVNSILVDCLEGFDGGSQQVFIMEVVELPSFYVRANITSNSTPNFEVIGLDRGLSYALNLFSANSKGRSEVVTIYTAARPSDLHTGVSSAFALSPVTASLLAAAAMMVVAAVAVSVTVYRRHNAGRHSKQPVSPLYAEDSLESLPRRDNLPSYTPSQKVDYSTQYELKTNGEVEDDSDIIPMHYDKKPVDNYRKSKVGEGDTVKVYRDHAIRLPNNGNISFVNRGVTARVRDLPVRESRI